MHNSDFAWELFVDTKTKTAFFFLFQLVISNCVSLHTPISSLLKFSLLWTSFFIDASHTARQILRSASLRSHRGIISSEVAWLRIPCHNSRIDFMNIMKGDCFRRVITHRCRFFHGWISIFNKHCLYIGKPLQERRHHILKAGLVPKPLQLEYSNSIQLCCIYDRTCTVEFSCRSSWTQ